MTIANIILVYITLFFQCSSASEYRDKIQPIFDNRCIACHSCLNGPCQLNLQNYENFERGAAHRNVYEGTRIDSVTPTRPGIDGKNVVEWRKLGFFDINQTRDLEKNLFYQMIGLTSPKSRDIPYKTVEESAMCMDNIDHLKSFFSQSSDLRMPYSLPAITKIERETIGAWLANGAPAPEKLLIPTETMPQVKTWENFFNQSTEKEKLVSRYIYEHLFLAHIYFPDKPETYYRLVRSKTACDSGIDEIATRRPNDDPGLKNFFYCLKILDATIVAKTHIPFEFNAKVLAHIKSLFFSTP